MSEDKKGPSVKIPPPLIYVALMVLGYFVNTLIPISYSFLATLKYFGIAVAFWGIIIPIYVSHLFKKAETAIEPWKPTTNIITDGIFGISRNPIYLGFNFVPIGLGIFFNNVWILWSFIPSAIILQLLVIKKEETYLEEKFGDEYRAYKNKVRRWI